jgi:hypothetical protein
MRRITLGVVLPVLFFLSPVGISAQSTDQWLGTWKLNVAKSKYDPGPAPTSSTVTYDMVNGVLRLTGDTISAKGEKTRTVNLITFDGKEQPVTGTANPTTRTFKSIDNRTFEFVTRVSGKVTGTTRVAQSPDGKTATVTNTIDKTVTFWERP